LKKLAGFVVDFGKLFDSLFGLIPFIFRPAVPDYFVVLVSFGPAQCSFTGFTNRNFAVHGADGQASIP
jgi:predicted sugar kinase